MKYENMNFDEGIKKEWIITNGIGGYASSTSIGINTRKYHGLLVAALTPPAQRNVILSKIDESIIIDNNKYNLYSNMCKDYISDGFKYLESFEKEYIPIYTYRVQDTLIKKYICMEHGKNNTVIFYRVFNGNTHSKLILTPLVNFREFHSDSNGHKFYVHQKENNGKLRLIVDGQSAHPIYINVNNGKYIKHVDDRFKNMYYIEEEKRGYTAEENHAIPGRYEIDILPNEQKNITFVVSLDENIEEIDGINIINKEIARLSGLSYDSLLQEEFEKIDTKYDKKKLIRDFIEATDNFIVYRPSFGLHTIIAGYPWFLDWGRDSLISYEGLLLKTKRYQIAKEVLLTMIRNVKYGLVPNRVF